MKVAILTFSCARNFGAMLQAYALRKYLCGIGVEAEIINYRPSYLYRPLSGLSIYDFNFFHPLRMFKRLFVMHPQQRVAEKKYSSFEKHYLYDGKEVAISDSDELKCYIRKRFQYVLIGSDQVWNCRYNGSDRVWYGHFDTPDINCASYAASAGSPKESDINRIRESLHCFDAVSVREEALANALAGESDRKTISRVCDPVFLLEPKQWKLTVSSGPAVDKPYILVYQGYQDDSIFETARILAARYNSEIVCVDNYRNGFIAGVIHKPAGPLQFLGFLKHSMCFLTTSFHGAAMSIILQIPFFVIRQGNGSDLRYKELLDLFGLSDRLIDRFCIPSSINCDFDQSVELMEQERYRARNFLNEIMKEWKLL